MKEEGTLESGSLIERVEDYVAGKKWGYVFISSSKHKTLFEISEDGIELLADSSSRWEVEHLLIQRGYMTESQLEKARRIAKETNKDLKPVINEQGFATTDQFEKASREQAWEILLDAFLIEEGEYEFREEKSRSEVDDELTPPFKFVFDHQEVIDEAKHRLSEYGTQKTLISDEHERYNIKEENLPEPEDVSEETKIHRIVKELRKSKSIKEILNDLNYSMYETYQVLTDLSMGGALQPMTEEEKLEAAREKLEDEAYDQAENLFKLYLSNHPEDLEVREELSKALSGAGKLKETAQLLVDTAKMYIDDQQLQKAHQLLKRAYDCDPDNEAVRKIWLDTVLDLNDPKSIRKTGGELIQSYIDAGNLKDAENVLDKLLERFPNSIRLLMTGADLAWERGNKEKMKRYIEDSAEALPEDIAPDSLEAVEYLTKSSSNTEEIENEIKRILGYHTPIFTFRNVGMLLLAVIIGAGVFAFARYEMHTRSVFREIDRRAKENVRRGQLDQALNIYEKFLEDYPFSYKRFTAQHRKAGIKEKVQAQMAKQKEEEDEQDNEKSSKKEVIFTKKVSEIRDRFLSPDSDIPYQKLQQQLVKLKEKQDPKSPKGKGTAQVLKKIRSKQAKAKSLLNEVKALTKDGNLTGARERIKTIRNNYSRTNAAEELFYPVKFSSLPPGAAIYIDGNKIGKTPLIYKFEHVRPYRITAVQRYYEKKNLRISPLDKGEHTVVLDKRIAWEKDLASSISARPTLLNEMILAGTDDGLIWQGTYERREQWRGTFKEGVAIRYLFSSASNQFFTLLEDGTLLSFSPSADQEVSWKKEFPDEELLKPVIDSDGGRILMPSRSNKVYVIDSRRGTIRSTISVPSTPISPVLPVDGGLYVVSSNNRIYEIDLGQAKVKNPLRLGEASELSLKESLITGTNLLLNTGENILGVDLSSRNVQTVLTHDSELFSTVEFMGSSLLFATKNGTLYRWDLKSGEKKWSKRLTEAPVAGPITSGEMVYVADRSGKLHGYHGPSGELYWTMDIPFGIPTSGLGVHDKKMVFGTDKGFLYKINLGTYE